MLRGYAEGRALRPTRKLLPEDARGHNRALVLQTLYRDGAPTPTTRAGGAGAVGGTGVRAGLSRADLARATGLTRVTVSDLVAELIGEGLVVELGPRDASRPGKPATLLELDRSAFRIVGLDLGAATTFRGAVLDLGGELLHRAEVPLDGAAGAVALTKVLALVDDLVARCDRPVLGIGIGSPGVVDLAGVVLSAPNLGWRDEPLQRLVADRTGHPTVVANDANVAALAEHSFGDGSGDLLVVTVGHGVGAGLLLGGRPVFGSRFAAGEIGHVVVGTDGGAPCACGKTACLETWLATPHLDAALAAAADDAARDAVLVAAGERLGIALAPVVGALDLAEVVLSGRPDLLDGALLAAFDATVRARTMPAFHGELVVRMSRLGEQVVVRGAAALVLSGQLGVS